ncbi:hypothetical protein DCC62_10540 [candidate division KSB1 bacterium]|nr:MAG: hypothetical protein DCC62_10540 [candidate division KSB1 bacterium]
MIKFMLDEDGNAGPYEPTESPSAKLAEATYEAIKAVKRLPAKLNGNPYRVWVALPVHFRLK